MKASSLVIEHLNAQLTNELTAINQYFLHARIYRHWGLSEIGDIEYKESIGEMKHADRLIERILMLDGLPNLQSLHKLGIGENVVEILTSDLGLERGSQKTVKDGIAACETEHDYVSRRILEDILKDTEEHIEWLETQLSLVELVGLQNYTQSQMGSGPNQ